ncbi:RNA-binding protein [Candidatus Marinamargulisbacteria bacterium SCGC AAA071-K20]|nr:RNA-binding protein [Candidatus Marinamargulisbacteria bacterium SCGC AAA071-K20]
MKIFYITTEYIELVRLLKAAGPYESEAVVKQSITDGLVTVDGEVETRRKCKIRPRQVVVAGEIEIKVKIGQ